MKVLTFDIEIRRKIKGKEPENPKYNYCKGWSDYSGMGISFLGAHTSWDNKIHYFDEKNLGDFIPLIQECDVVTGYNIVGFDIPLLKATLDRKKIDVDLDEVLGAKVYDVFYDIKANKKGSGWKLDDVATATLGFTKLGDGAMAPDLWQDKKYAELINYLAQDVRVEAALFEYAFRNKKVTNGSYEINLTQIHSVGRE